jgi:hypothetical protein
VFVNLDACSNRRVHLRPCLVWKCSVPPFLPEGRIFPTRSYSFPGQARSVLIGRDPERSEARVGARHVVLLGQENTCQHLPLSAAAAIVRSSARSDYSTDCTPKSAEKSCEQARTRATMTPNARTNHGKQGVVSANRGNRGNLRLPCLAVCRGDVWDSIASRIWDWTAFVVCDNRRCRDRAEIDDQGLGDRLSNRSRRTHSPTYPARDSDEQNLDRSTAGVSPARHRERVGGARLATHRIRCSNQPTPDLCSSTTDQTAAKTARLTGPIAARLMAFCLWEPTTQQRADEQSRADRSSHADCLPLRFCAMGSAREREITSFRVPRLGSPWKTFSSAVPPAFLPVAERPDCQHKITSFRVPRPGSPWKMPVRTDRASSPCTHSSRGEPRAALAQVSASRARRQRT